MVTKKPPKGGYTVFDYNPRTGRFEQRRAGRGSAYLNHRFRDFGSRGRLSDTFGRTTSRGYGGGGGFSKVRRAATKIGLLARRAHPVGRLISMGFDAANSLDGWSEWANTGPQETQLFDEAALTRRGWRSCENNEPPTSPGPCATAFVDPVSASACSVIPISGQAPPGGGRTTYNRQTGEVAGQGVIPAGTRVMRYGYYHNMFAPCNRVRVQGEWIAPSPNLEAIRVPMVRPSPAQPIPLSAPPEPVISETETPAPRDRVRPLPYQLPAISVDPGGNTDFPPHNRLPTPSRIRERKSYGSLRAALGVLAKLYDATTEADEIVDILYDRLGTKCKGARGMAQKANCVYRNLGTLDVKGSIADIVKNHYEDKLWGRIYGTVGKHTDWGSMLPGTGPTRQPGPITNLSQRS